MKISTVKSVFCLVLISFVSVFGLFFRAVTACGTATDSFSFSLFLPVRGFRFPCGCGPPFSAAAGAALSGETDFRGDLERAAGRETEPGSPPRPERGPRFRDRLSFKVAMGEIHRYMEK